MILTIQKILVTTRRLVPIAAIALVVPLVGACSSSSNGLGGSDAGDVGPHHDGAVPPGDTGSGKDGDTGGGTPGDGGGTSAVTTYCAAFLTAEAKAASQCFGGPEADWVGQLATATFCTEVAAAVTAGRVAYDASKGASCLEDLANVECATTTTVSAEPADCVAAITGKVASGAACHSNLDCSATDFCGGLGGTGGSCVGTCQPQLASGASCAAREVCAGGEACTGSPATCTAPATPVGKGINCLYDSSTKMAAPACQLGLSCDLSSFTCVDPVAPGDPCPPGHGVCAPFTYCDPTSKTCKPDPTVGGKCGLQASEDPIPCIGQSFCRASSSTATAGTCVALLAGGATCEASIVAPANAQCASGSCSAADGGPGTCGTVCTQE